MTRIESRLNDPVPRNFIFVNLYEQLAHFLKGALAASFSTSNQFVVQVPRYQGLHVSSANFYFAGLRYINPNANLTAMIHNDFGRNAELSVNVSYEYIPNWEVYAHFGSTATYTGNLSAIGRYEIAYLLSANSPAEDYAAWGTNTTLAIHIIELTDLWRNLVLDGAAGEDLSGRYDIGTSVSLSAISSVVSPSIVANIEKLARKFKDIDSGSHSFFCDEYIYNFMRHVHPVVNGCIDPIHAMEGNILHPYIYEYILNTTYQPRTSI